MNPRPLGTFGVGPGHAMAAKLARPGSRVPLVYGCGSFGPHGLQFEAMARVPTLAIRGENSDLLSAETLQEMTRRCPNCESWVVPGQGHAPLLTDSITIERIRTFVERVGF